MSTLLLLFQSFGVIPVTPSGVYALPLSGVVQAEYPGGREPRANLAGFVSEDSRIGGSLGAT